MGDHTFAAATMQQSVDLRYGNIVDCALPSINRLIGIEVCCPCAGVMSAKHIRLQVSNFDDAMLYGERSRNFVGSEGLQDHAIRAHPPDGINLKKLRAWGRCS